MKIMSVLALAVLTVSACGSPDLPPMPYSPLGVDRAIELVCADLADGLSPYQIVRAWEDTVIGVHPELSGPVHNQLRLEWVEAVRDKRCAATP